MSAASVAAEIEALNSAHLLTIAEQLDIAAKGCTAMAGRARGVEARARYLERSMSCLRAAALLRAIAE